MQIVFYSVQFAKEVRFDLWWVSIFCKCRILLQRGVGMVLTRKIKGIYPGRQLKDKAGVKLTRMFGQLEYPDFDPFLLLDIFDLKDSEKYIKGFPWQIDSGIVRMAYLIDGIAPQEKPIENMRLSGVQLCICVLSDKNMVEPAYHSIKSSETKLVEIDKAKVKVILGRYGKASVNFESRGPDTTLLDVEIKPYEEFEYKTEFDFNVSVFVIEGKGFFDNDKNDFVSKGSLANFEEGKKIDVVASSQGVRFLLLSGKPSERKIDW